MTVNSGENMHLASQFAVVGRIRAVILTNLGQSLGYGTGGHAFPRFHSSDNKQVLLLFVTWRNSPQQRMSIPNINIT